MDHRSARLHRSNSIHGCPNIIYVFQIFPNLVCRSGDLVDGGLAVQAERPAWVSIDPLLPLLLTQWLHLQRCLEPLNHRHI